MKFLIIIATLFMMGCFEQPKPINWIKGIPLMHECNQLRKNGYEVKDAEGCIKHIDHPKFKSGQILKMKESWFADSCRFVVARSTWGVIKTEKWYIGTVFCKGVDGKNVIQNETTYIEEVNLRK